MNRSEPSAGAGEQLLEHVDAHGHITSQHAGRLHQGDAAHLLPAAALTVIGRRWCRELAGACILVAANKPDTWTVAKGPTT